MEKFGLRILEGYGVTETAPVHRAQHADVQQARHRRPHAAGHGMRGWSRCRASTKAAASSCAGRTSWLGYLRAENPGVLEPLADGWHDTGDIVTIDARGLRHHQAAAPSASPRSAAR